MDDLFLIGVIVFLVLAVAASEVVAAVLPTLILVCLVPPHERAQLAELIAATGDQRRLGVRAAVRIARSASHTRRR